MFAQNIQQACAVDVDIRGYGVVLGGCPWIDHTMLCKTFFLLRLFPEEVAVCLYIIYRCFDALVQLRLEFVNCSAVSTQHIRSSFIPLFELVVVLLLLGHCHGRNHAVLLYLLTELFLPSRIHFTSRRLVMLVFRCLEGLTLVDHSFEIGVFLHDLLFGDLATRWLLVGLSARKLLIRLLHSRNLQLI